LEVLRIVSAEMLPAIQFVSPLICLVHQSVCHTCIQSLFTSQWFLSVFHLSV